VYLYQLPKKEKMKGKPIGLLLLFVLIPALFPAYAQKKWTLEECVTHALENNITIKQQHINTLYNRNVYNQSKAGLLPSLNAGGSYGASFGRALDQTTYSFTDNQTIQSLNLNINSTVSLFSGLQKMNSIEQNRLDLMASIEDLNKLKNDVSLNIAASYLQILFSVELLNVAKEQYEVTSRQVERTRALVDAGSVALGNLLEIQSQQAADELSVITSENNLNLAYLGLAQLMELDSLENFSILVPEIERIDESSLLVPIDQIYEEALQNLPQIKGSDLRLASSEKGLSIAKGSVSPRLSLSANYGTGYSDVRQQVTGTTLQTIKIGETAGGEDVLTTTVVPEYGAYPIPDQFRDNMSTSVYLNLNIPIFNNLQVKNNIDNAKLMVLNSRLDLDNQKKILYKEIQQAHADAIAALKKFNSSQKALAAMQESFKYTREKYEVGLLNAVDFNVAQGQLIMTQSEHLKAKYDFIFKTSILDFYRGKPLQLKI
jgi:outer membrane protein